MDASEAAQDARLSPSVAGLVRALWRHAPQPHWPVDEHRRRFEEAAAGRPLASGVRVTAVSTPGGQAEWAVPAAGEGRGAVLYLHGGGFIMGSLATSRPFATQLAAATNRPVLTLGYSLAPEARFPVQVDEVLRCHDWLLDQGVPSDQLVYVGDSAGAWLTVSALLRLRADARALPARAVLLSPLLDLALASPSIDEFAATDPQTPRWLLIQMCGSFLGDVSPADAAVAPLAADLTGLPPLLVQTAELEGLRGDAERFHAAATAAGTDCVLETWPGMIHVWHAFAPRLPEAADALTRVAGWLDAGR